MGDETDRLNWLAVDLDLTLANSTGYPEFKLLDPIHDNVRKLHDCVNKGYKIVIHTSRHWGHHKEVESWLDKHNIPYEAIVAGKLLAHRYIDDKAIPADAEWSDYL